MCMPKPAVANPQGRITRSMATVMGITATGTPMGTPTTQSPIQVDQADCIDVIPTQRGRKLRMSRSSLPP